MSEALVTLDGDALRAPRSVVTTASGWFWIPAVPPGRYTVRAARRPPANAAVGVAAPTAATAPADPVDVIVDVGGVVDVPLVLTGSDLRAAGPGSVPRPAAWPPPAPSVEARAPGRSFDLDWLHALPMARDAWGLVEQTPGVLGDAVPGGAPGDSQPAWSARGSQQDVGWHLDGATVTDLVSWAPLASIGFEAIGQARVQTGGHGPSVQGPGPSLDLVTRAGSSRFSLSGHGLYSGRALEAGNLTPELRDRLVDAGDQLLSAYEAGIDAGGPLVARRAWFFASFARTTRVSALHGIPVGGYYGASDPYDPDALVHHAASLDQFTSRIDVRPADDHELSVTASVGRKRRHPVDPSRYDAPESWRYQAGTTPLVRVSHQWITGPLAVTSRVSFADGGFAYQLQHPALADVQPSQDQPTRGWSRSGRFTRFDRRMVEAKSDAAFFATPAGWGDHRLSAGIRYRTDLDGEQTHVAGEATANFWKRLPNGATLYRDGDQRHAQTSVAAYLNDRVAFRRFTIDAGVRVDLQDDRSGPSFAPANPLLPEALPEARVAEIDSGVTFVDLVPRVGLTWNPGGDGKTAGRVHVAGYAAPGNRTSSWLDPSGPTALSRPWNDADGDGFVQRRELLESNALQGIVHPILLDPPLLTIDPALTSPRTLEVVTGVARRLPAGLVVEATYIVRRDDRPHTWFIDGVTSADFVPVTVATTRCEEGRCGPGSLTVTYYDLPFAPPEGRRVFNGSRWSAYRGVEFSLSRPYHRRLRAAATVTLHDTAVHYPAPDSYQDPTTIPFHDGRGRATFDARWDAKVSAFVALPWGFTTAAVVNGRDGYPFVKSIEVTSRRHLGAVTVPVEPIGDSRYGSVWSIDWKLQKRLRLAGAGVEVSLEVFNFANRATALRGETHQNIPTAGMPLAIMPPRVARIGITIGL